MLEIIGVWIAAFLTLAILSLIVKENPLYRFAEHIFVGVSAGYGVMNTFNQAIWPQIAQGIRDSKFIVIKIGTFNFMGQKVPFLTVGQLVILIGVILGIMILAKLEIFKYVAPNLRWISLYPLAVTIGIGTGIGLTAAFQGFIFPQVKATFLPLWTSNFMEPASLMMILSNWVFLIGVVTTILYFFFSAEQKGIMKPIVSVGIVFIMVAFGASFGYTVMGRISLLLGRIYFLLHNWLQLI
ncbi:MAG: hypothetical protein GXO39_00750 [Thermotogae bacterium]|nr:hypothetical protein [Thermotogota bacterium]